VSTSDEPSGAPCSSQLALVRMPSPTLTQLSSLIDVTGQALVLFGMDGRELSQNPVMRRMLGQEREREALLEHVRGVARAVLARTANGKSAA